MERNADSIAIGFSEPNRFRVISGGKVACVAKTMCVSRVAGEDIPHELEVLRDEMSVPRVLDYADAYARFGVPR